MCFTTCYAFSHVSHLRRPKVDFWWAVIVGYTTVHVNFVSWNRMGGCLWAKAGAVLAREKVRRQFAQWSSNECRCAVIPALPLRFSLWAGPASGFASLLIAFPLGGSMQRNACDGYRCPIRVITRLSTRPKDYGEAKWLVWGLNGILRFSPGVFSLNLLSFFLKWTDRFWHRIVSRSSFCYKIVVLQERHGTSHDIIVLLSLWE